MSDVIVISSATVERLRRKAKQHRKETGIAHHEALDLVARELGVFPDWHRLIEEAKATAPTEQAWKAGLIIGLDPKDVSPNPSQFVQDARVMAFLGVVFNQRHPKPWSEADELDWADFEELAYFRCKRSAPNTLDQALEMCRKDFFVPPIYVRLKGRVVKTFLQKEDGNV